MKGVTSIRSGQANVKKAMKAKTMEKEGLEKRAIVRRQTSMKINEHEISDSLKYSVLHFRNRTFFFLTMCKT